MNPRFTICMNWGIEKHIDIDILHVKLIENLIKSQGIERNKLTCLHPVKIYIHNIRNYLVS